MDSTIEAGALELQVQPASEPEQDSSISPSDDSKAVYDKNRGEDQWPEFAEEQPFTTRAIQYISNHSGAKQTPLRCWLSRLPRQVFARGTGLPQCQVTSPPQRRRLR